MKYGAPNENGDKPYIVELWSMGKVTDRLEWAGDIAEARGRYSRLGTGEYIKKIRRALVEEVSS